MGDCRRTFPAAADLAILWSRVEPLVNKHCRDDVLADRGRMAGGVSNTMKTSVAFVLLASPVLLTVGMNPASAASPAYCALYAREYAASRIGSPVPGDAVGALQRVEDQAYYRCLNQDDEPQFPTTSAYFGQPLDDITGSTTDTGGPFQALQDKAPAAVAADATAAAVADPAPPAPPKPAKPAAKPVQVASSAAASGGKPPPQWTPHWETWCAAHYKSFDSDTGYVLTLSREKKLCP